MSLVMHLHGTHMKQVLRETQGKADEPPTPAQETQHTTCPGCNILEGGFWQHLIVLYK